MPPLSGISVTPRIALVITHEAANAILASAYGRGLAKVAQQKLYKQLSYPCKFQKCVLDDFT